LILRLDLVPLVGFIAEELAGRLVAVNARIGGRKNGSRKNSCISRWNIRYKEV